MRRFKNLDKQRQKALTSLFPDLADLGESDNYHYVAVSVFDHWLNNTEVAELLDNVSDAEQKRRASALYSFSAKIASEYEVVNYKFVGKWASCYPLFRGFTSVEATLEYLKPAILSPRKETFHVAVPDLELVYVEDYDDTNVLFLRDRSVLNLLGEWAKICGLYCLEKAS